MQDKLEQYILSHISEEPPVLSKTYRDTYLHHLYPRMCSGHLQGRVLKMLTAMVAPRCVLELGAFTGYSTLCIAEGLPEGGELHTVEIDDELEDELLERFASSGYGESIHLHIGDALVVVPTLGKRWDMVFMDANKRHYPEYFDMLMPMVNTGGYIVADNTLWDGKVVEDPLPTDAQTQGIMKFKEMVAHDRRVETVILPVREGLPLIRKISD